MTTPLPIALTINAEAVQAFVEPRLSLADFLRTQRGLTGTRRAARWGPAAPAWCASTAASSTPA